MGESPFSDRRRRSIELPFLVDGRAMEMAEASLSAGMRGVRADLTLGRHTELLAFLAEQGLVRSVELVQRTMGTTMRIWSLIKLV